MAKFNLGEQAYQELLNLLNNQHFTEKPGIESGMNFLADGQWLKDAAVIERVEQLILENVGNLVCATSFDLGEDYRIRLIATKEGDDKPKKYSRRFFTSELMLVSKLNLLPHHPFYMDAVAADARDINPNIEVLQISSTSNISIDEWCNWLLDKVQEKQASLKETKAV